MCCSPQGLEESNRTWQLNNKSKPVPTSFASWETEAWKGAETLPHLPQQVSGRAWSGTQGHTLSQPSRSPSARLPATLFSLPAAAREGLG